MDAEKINLEKNKDIIVKIAGGDFLGNYGSKVERVS